MRRYNISACVVGLAVAVAVSQPGCQPSKGPEDATGEQRQTEAAAKKKPKATEQGAAMKPEATEQRAGSYLDYAKKLAASRMFAKAKERLQEIVRDFPDTKAAAEAKELLEKLKDEE